MISASGIELRAGARILIENASFRVAKGDRIGLVGRNGAVMLGSKGRGGLFDAAMKDAGPAGVYVVVDDVDAHHRRAVEHGAEILMPPTDQDYGSRDYMARDLEGNLWSFGTYAPEIQG